MRFGSVALFAAVAISCGPKAGPTGNGYGPAAGEYAWSTVSPLHQGRIEHTATLLRDSRVLVVGGEFQDGTGWQVLDAAEVFDPKTRSWTTSAGLNEGRSGHTATLLQGGRVLVVGGQGGSALDKRPLSSVEEYIPHADRWKAIAPLHTPRFGHTATELADGRILVVGGVGPKGLAGTEVYDPRTQRWTPAAPLREQRRGHVAVTLPDERVLVAGGLGAEGVLDSVEMYDPRTNRWIPAPDMGHGRDGHAAVVLPDGTVLVAGGYELVGFSEAELGVTEVYNPLRNEWTEVSPLASARRGHDLIVLQSGQVLALGGALLMQAVGNPEVYADGEWTALAPVPERLYGAATTLAAPGQVLVVGGWNQFDLHSEVAMLFEVSAR